jgi:hypothetical protein
MRLVSDRGVARTGDPITSHLATTRVAAPSNGLRWTILTVLYDHAPGGLYDEQLVHILPQAMGEIPFTRSGAQTRRRELADLGLVHIVGKTRNVRGRSVLIWGLTEIGSEVVEQNTPEDLAQYFVDYRREMDRMSQPSAVIGHERQFIELQQIVAQIMDAAESADAEDLRATVDLLRRSTR